VKFGGVSAPQIEKILESPIQAGAELAAGAALEKEDGA
jgi:hypothetical protein